MRKLLIAVTALMACGCGSIHPRPTVIVIGIDEAFSLEPVTTACSFKAAESSKAPQYVMPCLESPGIMLQEVRSAFQSAFQENPECAGVSLRTYENVAAMTGGVDWRMKFFVRAGDDGAVSVADSSWEIDSHAKVGGSVNGTIGDPFQTATRICTAVKGRGGTVQ